MEELVKTVKSLPLTAPDDVGALENIDTQARLYKELDGLSAVEMHGWLIIARKTHIAEDEAVEKLHATLGFPPPEILFDKNLVTVVHQPSGKSLSFDTLNALRGVVGEPHGLKRPELKLKTKPGAEAKAQDIDVQNDFDWTYTSAFSGAVLSLPGCADRQGASIEWTIQKIDYELLKRREPIVFYSSISLYEDELHDHGHTGYTVKLRVMPSCFYILARFFLRVDRSVIRVIDTRVFFPFPSTATAAARDFINLGTSREGIEQPLPSGASGATEAAQAVKTGVATAATWGTDSPTSRSPETSEAKESYSSEKPVTLLREITVRETTFLKLAEEGKSTNPKQYLDPDNFAHTLPIVSQYTQAIRFQGAVFGSLKQSRGSASSTSTGPAAAQRSQSINF